MEDSRTLSRRARNSSTTASTPSTCSPYVERFTGDCIHIPLFDDLETGPNTFAQELFAFLGADPMPLPTELTAPVNPAAEPRHLCTARMASGAARL